MTSDEFIQSAEQSEPAFDMLNDMLYGHNIPDLANEAQLNLPQPNSSIHVLQGQQQQSLSKRQRNEVEISKSDYLQGTPSSFGHQNQDGQSLGNLVSQFRGLKSSNICFLKR
jgi:hypothetical protein